MVSFVFSQATVQQASRVRIVKVIVIVSFLAGMLFSMPLWFGERFFPTAPVADGFSIGTLATSVTTLVFVGSMIGALFFPRRGLLYVSLAAMLVLLLADQNRWQPWVYMYILMLLILASRDNAATAHTARAFRIVLIGIYFWSGVHKLNPDFIEFGFTRMAGLVIDANSDLIRRLKPFGYGIGMFEMLIAACLFFPAARKWGIALATICHVAILLYLSPIGIDQNYVVYPWNIAMLAMVIALFFRSDEPILVWPARLRAAVTMMILLVLTWGAPALNLFGKWDHYLSFSLYSNKASGFLVAVEEGEVPKLDTRLKAYFARVPGLTGGALIDVNLWCMGELNVPFYPESRVFRRIASEFCSLGIENEKLVFLELKRPYHQGRYHHFKCADPE